MADVNIGPLELNQLLACRTACETAMRSIDGLFGMLDAQKQEEEQAAVKADPNTCKHPRNKLKAAAVMGRPNRAFCGLCNAELEIKR